MTTTSPVERGGGVTPSAPTAPAPASTGSADGTRTPAERDVALEQALGGEHRGNAGSNGLQAPCARVNVHGHPRICWAQRVRCPRAHAASARDDDVALPQAARRARLLDDAEALRAAHARRTRRRRRPRRRPGSRARHAREVHGRDGRREDAHQHIRGLHRRRIKAHRLEPGGRDGARERRAELATSAAPQQNHHVTPTTTTTHLRTLEGCPWRAYRTCGARGGGDASARGSSRAAVGPDETTHRLGIHGESA